MFKTIINRFQIPSWLLPINLGIFTGLSAFTLFYANGTSYFSNDPKTCINCHIMREQFDAWNRSSHKSVATSNSCHTPKNFAGKYAVKGINGWNHSVAFTTGNFHSPLQIKPLNRNIVLHNCVNCHKEMICRMVSNSKGEKADCISCHGNVGHRGRK